MTNDKDWKPFKAFEQIANIDLQDPNTRLIDLKGNGQPELVMTEENVFVWYAADGKRGHLPAEFAHKTFDEEKGPAIVFADQEQSIFTAKSFRGTRVSSVKTKTEQKLMAEKML